MGLQNIRRMLLNAFPSSRTSVPVTVHTVPRQALSEIIQPISGLITQGKPGDPAFGFRVLADWCNELFQKHEAGPRMKKDFYELAQILQASGQLKVSIPQRLLNSIARSSVLIHDAAGIMTSPDTICMMILGNRRTFCNMSGIENKLSDTASLEIDLEEGRVILHQARGILPSGNYGVVLQGNLIGQTPQSAGEKLANIYESLHTVITGLNIDFNASRAEPPKLVFKPAAAA